MINIGIVYIIIGIFAFGVLIAVHELGHFIAAKSLGVRVNEFAIGMGPALFKREKGETLYSLRLFPIGGFCAMEGEDAESNDPRAFGSQSIWRRLIILISGSVMNFLAGFITILILFSASKAFYTTTVGGFYDGFELQGENGLMEGDRIVEINNENIYIYTDFYLFMSRSAGEPVDVTVLRGGERVTLKGLPLTVGKYYVGGTAVSDYGIDFKVVRATLPVRLSLSFYNSIDFARIVRLSVFDLITGKAGAEDLTGPIGIMETIKNTGQQAANVREAAENIAYLFAFIAINLSVMNMLPIPALDGGRVFFLFITRAVELIRKKPVNPKYEGYIHFAGLIFFFALMAYVAYNDIARLFTA